MAVVLEVTGHGDATIVSTDGTRVVLECAFTSPPGSSLSCALPGDAKPIKVKVSSCKRSDERPMAFRIEGRFVDLTREQRATLTAQGSI